MIFYVLLIWSDIAFTMKIEGPFDSGSACNEFMYKENMKFNPKTMKQELNYDASFEGCTTMEDPFFNRYLEEWVADRNRKMKYGGSR